MKSKLALSGFKRSFSESKEVVQNTVYSARRKVRLGIRSIIHFKQRVFRGFDDSETYSLDISLLEGLVSRMARFRELSEPVIVNRYPRPKKDSETLDEYLLNTEKEFNETFDEFMEVATKALRLIDDGEDAETEQEKAWGLFMEIRPSLWW